MKSTKKVEYLHQKHSKGCSLFWIKPLTLVRQNLFRPTFRSQGSDAIVQHQNVVEEAPLRLLWSPCHVVSRFKKTSRKSFQDVDMTNDNCIIIISWMKPSLDSSQYTMLQWLYNLKTAIRSCFPTLLSASQYVNFDQTRGS